jgi:hypothetical protein
METADFDASIKILKAEPKVDEMAELRARFTLTCRRCKSQNVVVDVEPARIWSEVTAQDGAFSMGCNDCKANDFHMTL